MPQSKVIGHRQNAPLEFDQNTWVVSILNVGKGFEGWLMGHNVILVEGLKIARNGGGVGQGTELYVWSFDVFSKNGEYITDINIGRGYHLSNKTNKIVDYNQFTANSSRFPREAVEEMIKSIEEDKRLTDEAKENKEEYPLPYSLRGKAVSESHPHNCASWCVEKVKIAAQGQAELSYSKRPQAVAKQQPREIQTEEKRDGQQDSFADNKYSSSSGFFAEKAEERPTEEVGGIEIEPPDNETTSSDNQSDSSTLRDRSRNIFDSCTLS